MTIDNYGGLAAVYDRLNAEIDYARWAAYIQAQIAAHSDIPVSLVLDLCCGTGSMTLALDALGYDMIGADISLDMLAVAREKAAEAGRAARILFLCQDMRALELYGTVQAVTCTLDALNHVDGAGDLARVFSLVRNYLEPGGLFLFDLNTPYKFEHIYGTNAYILEDDGIFCGWQNVYDPARRVCDFYTTVFLRRPDGAWTRREDHEREYCFLREEIEEMLGKNGFSLICVHGDTAGSEPLPDGQRLYFTAKRK